MSNNDQVDDKEDPYWVQEEPEPQTMAKMDDEDASDADFVWPDGVDCGFVISICDKKWTELKTRLGTWQQHIQLWPGTDGRQIDIDEWTKQGRYKVVPECRPLRKGELGCFDSHFRLWQHMITNNIRVALILEDDAAIVPQRHGSKIAEVLRAAAELPSWDLIYLGHSMRKNHIGPDVSDMFNIPLGWQGLFGYILTFRGATQLIKSAQPFCIPADVYVAKASANKTIDALAVKVPLFYVVKGKSTTYHIT